MARTRSATKGILLDIPSTPPCCRKKKTSRQGADPAVVPDGAGQHSKSGIFLDDEDDDIILVGTSNPKPNQDSEEEAAPPVKKRGAVDDGENKAPKKRARRQRKPRPDIIIYSKPGKMKELKDNFQPEQKWDIIRIGFGGLLDMEVKTVPDDMDAWLIEAFDPDNNTIVWNGDILYELTPEDVHDTLSLPLCPDNAVDESADHRVRNLRKRWERDYGFSTTERTSLGALQDQMMKIYDGGEDFIRMFVVFAVSAFLAPVSNGSVDFRTLRTVMQVEDIQNYDWCGFVLDKLSAAVRRFKRGLHQQAFSGCFLQLVISHMHRMERKGWAAPKTTPLVKHWTTEELQKCFEALRAAGGYGLGFVNNVDYPITKSISRPRPRFSDALPSISFTVPPSYRTDSELEALLPHDFQRKAAGIARDLDIVIGDRLNNLVPPSYVCEELTFPRQLIDFVPKLLEKVDRTIDALKKSKDLLSAQFQAMDAKGKSTDKGKERARYAEDGSAASIDVNRSINLDLALVPYSPLGLKIGSMGSTSNKGFTYTPAPPSYPKDFILQRDIFNSKDRVATEQIPTPTQYLFRAEEGASQQVDSFAENFNFQPISTDGTIAPQLEPPLGGEDQTAFVGTYEFCKHSEQDVNAHQDGLEAEQILPCHNQAYDCELTPNKDAATDDHSDAWTVVVEDMPEHSAAAPTAAVGEGTTTEILSDDDMTNDQEVDSQKNEELVNGKNIADCLVDGQTQVAVMGIVETPVVGIAEGAVDGNNGDNLFDGNELVDERNKEPVGGNRVPNSSTGHVDPWSTWYLNTTNTHNSKVVNRLFGRTESTIPRHILEIADFCISPSDFHGSRETIPYDDGTLVLMIDAFKGFEHRVKIQPELLTAWSRCLNQQPAATFPLTRYCLDVVPSNKWDDKNDALAEHWETGMLDYQRPIKDAQLIFVPVCFSGHYALLLLNFTTRHLQYLDSSAHSNRLIWEEAAKKVRHSLATWLEKCGHPHAPAVRKFKLKVVGGDWRASSRRADAAIYVMHLMKCYSGDLKDTLLQNSILQTYSMAERRVSFCCDIVLSTANRNKQQLLDLVPLNISSKIHRRP